MNLISGAYIVKDCSIKWGCSSWDTTEDMLIDSNLDIIYLSTPPGLHYEQGMRVLRSNKHLWCEKPITLNFKQTINTQIMKKLVFSLIATVCLAITVSAQTRNEPVKVTPIQVPQSKTAADQAIVKTNGKTNVNVTKTTPEPAPVNPNAPEITFDSDVMDYGTVEYNGDGLREFVFKNTGKEPLIISRAKGSCGCTVPSPPKDPIAPGESGVIKVKYDTNRSPGPIRKTITVYTNASAEPYTLKIKGTLLPATN